MDTIAAKAVTRGSRDIKRDLLAQSGLAEKVRTRSRGIHLQSVFFGFQSHESTLFPLKPINNPDRSRCNLPPSAPGIRKGHKDLP